MELKKLKEKIEEDYNKLPLEEKCDKNNYLYILIFEILPYVGSISELLDFVEMFDEEHDENLLTYLYNNYL